MKIFYTIIIISTVIMLSACSQNQLQQFQSSIQPQQRQTEITVTLYKRGQKPEVYNFTTGITTYNNIIEKLGNPGESTDNNDGTKTITYIFPGPDNSHYRDSNGNYTPSAFYQRTQQNITFVIDKNLILLSGKSETKPYEGKTTSNNVSQNTNFGIKTVSANEIKELQSILYLKHTGEFCSWSIPEKTNKKINAKIEDYKTRINNFDFTGYINDAKANLSAENCVNNNEKIKFYKLIKFLKL